MMAFGSSVSSFAAIFILPSRPTYTLVGDWAQGSDARASCESIALCPSSPPSNLSSSDKDNSSSDISSATAAAGVALSAEDTSVVDLLLTVCIATPPSSLSPTLFGLCLTKCPLHIAWNLAIVFLVRTARLYKAVSPTAST